MRDPHITLTALEAEIAKYVGKQRDKASVQKGQKPTYGFDGTPGKRIMTHILGASAEMAFCKWRNVYWIPTIDNHDGPDVGEAIQIRSAQSDGSDMVIRTREIDKNPDHFFVFVPGTVIQRPENVFTVGLEFRVVGWILAKAVSEGRSLEPRGGRPPAYFVTQEDLEADRRLEILWYMML